MKELAEVLAAIEDPGEMELFLGEILTARERNDLALRWQLLIELYQGQTQRSIAARHKISLCKITRGSKILRDKGAVTRQILQRFHGEEENR